MGRKAKSVSQLKSAIDFPLDLKRKNLNHDIPCGKYTLLSFFIFNAREIPTARSRLNKQGGCRPCLYFIVWVFGRLSESAPFLLCLLPSLPRKASVGRASLNCGDSQ